MGGEKDNRWTYLCDGKVVAEKVKRDEDPVIGASVIVAGSVTGPAPVEHYIIESFHPKDRVVLLDKQRDRQ